MHKCHCVGVALDRRIRGDELFRNQSVLKPMRYDTQ